MSPNNLDKLGIGTFLISKRICHSDSIVPIVWPLIALRIQNKCFFSSYNPTTGHGSFQALQPTPPFKTDS